MKNKFLVVLALILLVSAMPLMAEMTADEIISKHLTAYGGEDILHGVKSLSLKGSMFMQGMPLELKMYIVFPDKSYMEVSSNNMVLGGGGTNATDAWATQMGTTYILEGEEKEKAKQQVDHFALLDYKKKGSTAKFIGEDLVKGAKAYKVEFVSAKNDTTQYFFDAETYYIVREKDSQSSRDYSNHKKIDGVVFPSTIKAQVSAQGQMMQQMITFDSIFVNVSVADSLFVMPKSAQPMPKEPAMPDTGKPAESGDGK